MLHEIVFYTVVALLAASGYWYWHTMRQWVLFMKSPAVEALDETGRSEIMSTPEYARLRNAVRNPMRLSLLLACALVFVMRFNF